MEEGILVFFLKLGGIENMYRNHCINRITLKTHLTSVRIKVMSLED